MGVFKILRSIKSIFIHIRSSLKLIFLLIIGAAIIIGAVSLIYKPAYAVTLNGEFLGYTSNKSKLQDKINEYMKTGDGENIAFVDIQTLPEYSFCFLKRNTELNEENIIANVKELGTVYYEYYAIVLNNKEKSYVKTKKEAEEVIANLKKKKSSNVSKIAYTEIHDTELKKFTKVATIVDDLYVKPVTVAAVSSGGGGLTSVASYTSKPDLGISLVRPTSGIITARFGSRGYAGHTGLDIAGSHGSAIKAVAGGTVVAAGNSGSGYGIYVKIRHTNGIETLYGHCSSVNVSVGDSVSQGERIASMGSTGRSTGTHLHLEIRKNGTALNPENYVY